MYSIIPGKSCTKYWFCGRNVPLVLTIRLGEATATVQLFRSASPVLYLHKVGDIFRATHVPLTALLVRCGQGYVAAAISPACYASRKEADMLD